MTNGELLRLDRYIEALKELVGSSEFTESVLFEETTRLISLGVDVPFEVYEKLKEKYLTA